MVRSTIRRRLEQRSLRPSYVRAARNCSCAGRSLDAPTPQAMAQRIAVVGFVGDHARRLLSRTARLMPPAYADHRERRSH